jgi:hypothetical protein
MTTTAPSPSGEPKRPDQFGRLTDDLRADLAALRAAHADLRSAEGAAWRTYSDQLQAVLKAMDDDLYEHRAALADASEHRRAELRAALRRVIDRGARALDEARVQEALAELEVKDQLGDRWEELAAASARLRGTAYDLLTALRGDDPSTAAG